jgi:hypothetical protein
MFWRASVGYSNRRPGGYASAAGSPAVDVASPPLAVRLRPELPLQVHDAPDRGAVGADVGLDLGGHLTDGGQVDAEQLRALLQRRRDWPAQVRVVPSPHRNTLSNRCSEQHRECYRPRPDGTGTRMGAARGTHTT